MRDPRRWLYETEDPAGAVEALVRAAQPPPSAADRLLGAAGRVVDYVPPLNILKALGTAVHELPGQYERARTAEEQANQARALGLEQAQLAKPYQADYRSAAQRELAETESILAAPSDGSLTSEVDRTLARTRAAQARSNLARGTYEPIGAGPADLDLAGKALQPLLDREREAATLDRQKAFERFQQPLKSQEMLQGHQYRMAEIEASQRANTAGMKPATANAALDFSKFVERKRGVFFQQEADIEQAIQAPPTGFGDLQALYAFVKNQDNTAAREGELALAQTAASVADRIQRLAKNVGEGRVLGDEQRKEILEIMQGYKEKVRKLHQDYVKRAKTTADGFGLDADTVIPQWREFSAGKAERPKITPEEAAAELARRRSAR